MALCFFCKAQNLVPNYSFEIKTQCSNGVNQVDGYVNDWSGGGGGQCFYDSLCNNVSSDVNVPLNIFGYQYPHSGAAYVGIYTFTGVPPTGRPYDYNNVAYLQAELTSTLNTGTEYYVTFYISLADSSKWACNNIGVYFSDSALVWTGYVKSYLTPQVQNDTANHLTDKINWMKISGSFKSNGTEKYIILGNFVSDKQCDTIFVNSPSSNSNHNWNEAYYYVDDVIVSADSNYADSLFPNSVSSITMPQNETKVYPNPSNGKFTIEEQGVRDKEQIEIYNMMGQKVASSNSSKGGASVVTAILPSGGQRWAIDLSNQPAGIYLYRIVSEKGEAVGTGKLIIQ